MTISNTEVLLMSGLIFLLFPVDFSCSLSFPSHTLSLISSLSYSGLSWGRTLFLGISWLNGWINLWLSSGLFVCFSCSRGGRCLDLGYSVLSIACFSLGLALQHSSVLPILALPSSCWAPWSAACQFWPCVLFSDSRAAGNPLLRLGPVSPSRGFWTDGEVREDCNRPGRALPSGLSPFLLLWVTHPSSITNKSSRVTPRGSPGGQWGTRVLLDGWSEWRECEMKTRTHRRGKNRKTGRWTSVERKGGRVGYAMEDGCLLRHDQLSTFSPTQIKEFLSVLIAERKWLSEATRTLPHQCQQVLVVLLFHGRLTI